MVLFTQNAKLKELAAEPAHRADAHLYNMTVSYEPIRRAIYEKKQQESSPQGKDVPNNADVAGQPPTNKNGSDRKYDPVEIGLYSLIALSVVGATACAYQLLKLSNSGTRRTPNNPQPIETAATTTTGAETKPTPASEAPQPSPAPSPRARPPAAPSNINNTSPAPEKPIAPASTPSTTPPSPQANAAQPEFTPEQA